MRFLRTLLRCLSLLVLVLPVSLSAQENTEVLTVYSGRAESLVGPLLAQFTADTGIQVQVLYGSTDDLAAQILTEGSASPADVYIAQDAGALGALSKAGRLAPLPNDVVERVAVSAFVSPERLWVGLSARARVLVYNPEMLAERNLDLPASVLDLVNPEWQGLVGWAPTNASFRSNVTAMRLLLGDNRTFDWLEGLVNNGVRAYQGNTAVVEAVINGEIAVGLVNHYYLFRYRAENPELTTGLHFFPGGDPGALVNIAGAGVLDTSDQKGLAQRLLLYMLGNDAQTYFATQTYEYPIIAGVEPNAELPALDSIQVPDIDLTDLDDLQGSIDLIEQSGALDG